MPINVGKIYENTVRTGKRDIYIYISISKYINIWPVSYTHLDVYKRQP